MKSFAICVAAIGVLLSCAAPSEESVNSKAPASATHQGRFGSCCNELKDAMEVPNSAFRIESDGVFFFTVGHVDTEDGPGFFDQAVLHCPFCGARLQDRARIAERAGP